VCDICVVCVSECMYVMYVSVMCVCEWCEATGRATETKGRQRDAGTYSRALGSAHFPTPATQKRPAEWQRPRDTGRTPERHRGVQPSPWQCTLSHACHAKASGRAAETKGHRTDARGTLGRTAEPVAVHSLPRLPRKSQRQSCGDQGTRDGR